MFSDHPTQEVPHAEGTQTDYTVAQAAEQKQVSPKTIRRAIARGEIEAHRVGPRLIRIPAASLASWGRSLQVIGGAL